MGLLSNIIFHEKFIFCLTCMKVIGSGHYNDALTHVIGRKHLKNLKILFKTCITDPFCNCNDAMYSRVIREAKLDISKLLQSCNEKNYIYVSGESLICFVCKETVSNSTTSEQIKKDLVTHLGTRTKAHSQIMKDASWIYYLPNANGYIMFNKAFVHCSLCDVHVDFVDDLKLHAAVGHLQTRQHINNTQKGIAQDSVLVDVTRAGGSGGLGISAPARDCLSTPQGSQPRRQPVNINKMEYDSIKRLLADRMFGPHVQFLEFKGDSFMCTLCDVQLSISPSGSFNLEEHIVGSAHRKLAEKRQMVTPDCILTVSRNLIPTSAQDQINKLSLEPEFAPHVKYLVIKGDQCRCLICDVSLTVSIKLNDNLKNHIRGATHKKRHKKMLVTDLQKVGEQMQNQHLNIRELLKSIDLNSL